MRMKKNEWKALDDRLVRMIKNEVGAVAIKFAKTQEQLDAIDELIYWPKQASVCKAIGLAAYWKKTVAMTDKILNDHCGENCGTYPHGELFEKGHYLSEVRKWFTRPLRLIVNLRKRIFLQQIILQ